MKYIEVETFLNPIEKGISRPSLVLCDDGNNYILKKEGDNFNSTLINEVISYKIALYLDVPVCESAIARINKDLIDFDRNIFFVNKFKEGDYFASLEEKPLVTNLLENTEELMKMGKPYISRTWNDFFKNIANKKDFAKIIAFDFLIVNFDRFNHLDNFLVSKENDKNKFIAIDHGLAFFGGVWTMNKIKFLDGYNFNDDYWQAIFNFYEQALESNQKTTNLGFLFKSIEPYIDVTDLENNDFTNVIFKIESLTRQKILEMFNDIPDEWFVDKDLQISCYTEFLLQHKNNIRHIIQLLANQNYFTNFKGGTLKWIEEEKLDKRENIQ
ncbi:phosphatidylinositol 4-kinase [Staphylococcus warneri]|uniref:HipA family kinase n=1 Tax=Staphylococcus warneri TaxID=1292 RepID=UPI002DBF9153|nr:HipA family kinase [Staphylococcus warneri]MEB7383143.1 phosphatidylinositol 4-kinase [Staphylococcus warneri]